MSLGTRFYLHWVGHAAQEAPGSRSPSTAAVRGLLCGARDCQGSLVGKSVGLAPGGVRHQEDPAGAVLRAAHPPTPAWKWAAHSAEAAQEARRLRTLAAAVHLSHTGQLLRSVTCDQLQFAHSCYSEAANWAINPEPFSRISYAVSCILPSCVCCSCLWVSRDVSCLPFTWRWWACRAEGWAGSSAWWTWVRWSLLGSTGCTWLPHSSCRACTFAPLIAPCSQPWPLACSSILACFVVLLTVTCLRCSARRPQHASRCRSRRAKS